jgi:hypothetical protein
MKVILRDAENNTLKQELPWDVVKTQLTKLQRENFEGIAKKMIRNEQRDAMTFIETLNTSVKDQIKDIHGPFCTCGCNKRFKNKFN